MFISVTEETGPAVLVADSRKWTKIGEDYYQSDTVNGVCLEIHKIAKNVFRWFVYYDKSAVPDMAVTFDEKPTLAEALTDANDYVAGNY